MKRILLFLIPIILVASVCRAGVLSIVLESRPDGADVYIDDEYKGKTNSSWEAASGVHTIRIELDGYDTIERTVTLGDHDSQTIRVTLVESRASSSEGVIDVETAPKAGSLFVKAPYPGARLFVDGKDYGQAPQRLDDLPVGGYLVEVLFDGQALSQYVRVLEGEVTVVDWAVGHAVPSPAVPPQPARVSYYDVIGVESWDVLNIRDRPHWKATKVGEIPHDGTCVAALGPSRKVGKSIWLEIRYGGYRGWVNSSYLASSSGCM